MTFLQINQKDYSKEQIEENLFTIWPAHKNYSFPHSLCR